MDDGFEALKFYPIDFDSDGNEDCPVRVLSSDRLSLGVERVEAVREEVGGAVKLLVDIFGHLDPKSATQLGKELEKFDIFFYEEPVDAMNFDCLKKVANNVDIPIAAGERLYTRYGFRKYIENQIIDLLQPDIGLTGGITETKKIADYAETYNQNVQPHNWGSPISTAVAVQLDACISNFIIQETLPYMSEKNYEIVENPYEKNIKNGYIEIPERPGLGIKLNDDTVTEYMCLQIE